MFNRTSEIIVRMEQINLANIWLSTVHWGIGISAPWKKLQTQESPRQKEEREGEEGGGGRGQEGRGRGRRGGHGRQRHFRGRPRRRHSVLNAICDLFRFFIMLIICPSIYPCSFVKWSNSIDIKIVSFIAFLNWSFCERIVRLGISVKGSYSPFI